MTNLFKSLDSLNIYQKTKNIQFLRLLFLVSVVSVHAGCPFLGEGEEICSFFFIVSGFLFKSNLNGAQYCWKKFKSLYPIYIIFFVTFIVGSIFTNKTCSVIENDIWWHLLLLQSFNIGNHICATRYLSPAWFLSSLLFCYLFAPLLKRLIANVSARYCAISMAILFIFGLIYINLVKGNEFEIWLSYINPLFRLCEYLIGMLLSKIVLSISNRKIPPIVTIIFFIIYFFLLRTQVLGKMSGVAHVVLIAFLVLTESRTMDLVMGNEYVCKLADLGIFIYLGHYPILKFLGKFSLCPECTVAISVVICIGIGIAYNMLRSYFSQLAK